MTQYFVGKMGNDANSGRTWGTRLATLNGAEDKPVAPGDTVWVAPGVYRELLTVDVSGAAGRPITYIADVTGENTDGVGGIVRVTGSDNDQTAARAQCVSANDKDYRTFRGFTLDTVSTALVSAIIGCTNWIVEDCWLESASTGISFGGTSSSITLRRLILLTKANGIQLNHSATHDDSAIIIENCLVISQANSGRGVNSDRVGGVAVRNCAFIACSYGIRVGTSLTVGQFLTANNCIFAYCGTGVRATAVAELAEDYNAFWGNGTDRNTVNTGANSNAYPPLFRQPVLYSGASQASGFRLPWWFGELSQWSQIKQIAGSNEPDEDLFGIRRPYTHGGPVAASCSWGPVQWTDFRRDTLRAHDGSLSARVKEKSKTWMFVPGIGATQHTISAWSYRTAGYGGQRNPEMVIKQPGQADRRTVAGGAAGAWVQVTDTFTPGADPPWLTVEMWNQCEFTTTTTVSTTSTTTVSTTSTTTVTVTTLTTTTTTLACDVWWDDIQVT